MLVTCISNSLEAIWIEDLQTCMQLLNTGAKWQLSKESFGLLLQGTTMQEKKC